MTPQGQISPDNVRMSLVIPKDLKAELDLYAKSQDRSTNKIITYAIREYLSNHKANES
jgi:metal-responsive CopG/Arc/MetJ family transcriptional regulator